MHHLARMAGKLFFDGDDGQVVKDAGDGQVQVHDLRQHHLHQRQEEALGDFAQVTILHRRPADDSGGVDGIFPMRDGGDMEDGVVVRQRVVSGVVAERSFPAALAGVHVALDDEISVGGHLQVVRQALHHLHRLAAQEAGEDHLVNAFRQRRGGSVGDGRVAAHRHRYRHARALPLVRRVVPGAGLVNLPVHAGGAGIEDLHAIHAAVAPSRFWIAGKDHRQREEGAAVLRPAGHHRQPAQVGWVHRHLLAWGAADRLR
ncbi:MAG: hypothetical protein BWY76_03038 [bacterium ADurb.Bin429]|nr:MAG: hypothetical protein BWY76_03038 [bacterium ADurb.Bin429]